ncbi:MAG: hypothetical protein ACLVCW_01585 [Campylobacter sp.]
MGRKGGLNCEVAPLPAPSPTHPPTTLEVQAFGLSLFYALRARSKDEIFSKYRR